MCLTPVQRIGGFLVGLDGRDDEAEEEDGDGGGTNGGAGNLHLVAQVA